MQYFLLQVLQVITKLADKPFVLIEDMLVTKKSCPLCKIVKYQDINWNSDQSDIILLENTKTRWIELYEGFLDDIYF